MGEIVSGKKRMVFLFVLPLLISTVFLSGCVTPQRWGIYSLDIESGKVELIYTSGKKISTLRLSTANHRFVFSQQIDGEGNEYEEICTVGVDGSNFVRLTNNSIWDLYPAWSPDGTRIAFLSLRERDLDIYVMDADGSNVTKLYDSGYHDADIHWAGERIVFTSNSRIWTIRDDGTDPFQVTEPPRAGEWGNANLPFGDYDPQFNREGTRIAFERLENDTSPHGNYNIHVVNADGSGETPLTDTGYSQGFPSWSHSGDAIVYLIAAINTTGYYDMYMMNADGTENHDITPEYFPSNFLCHSPIFSEDDSKIYFVGELWENTGNETF